MASILNQRWHVNLRGRRSPIYQSEAVGVVPNVLYRYFDDLGYTKAFCSGDLRLSTINACRETADAARGDADEARLFYSSGTFTSGQPGFDVVAARVLGALGLDVPSHSGSMLIADNTYTEELRDGHLLCFSKHLSDELRQQFGRHVVRINSPLAFFRRLSRFVAHTTAISQAVAGHVTYNERSFSGADPLPGARDFIKPDRYRLEAEYRMMWVPQGSPRGRFERLEKLAIKYEPLGNLCKLLG